MNIGVVGCGYVGLTNASVWARKYSVGLWDSDNDKILEIKQGKIPFKDEHLEKGFGKLCDNFILYNTFEEFVAVYGN